jgi:hypothetical protein
MMPLDSVSTTPRVVITNVIRDAADSKNASSSSVGYTMTTGQVQSSAYDNVEHESHFHHREAMT